MGGHPNNVEQLYLVDVLKVPTKMSANEGIFTLNAAGSKYQEGRNQYEALYSVEYIASYSNNSKCNAKLSS